MAAKRSAATERALARVEAGETAYAAAKAEGIALSTIYRALRKPEASTTLEHADDHAHICFKLAEQYKSDPVLFAALTDAAAIIRDLMCGRLQTAKSVQTAWQRGLQQGLMPLKTGIPVLQGGEDVK